MTPEYTPEAGPARSGIDPKLAEVLLEVTERIALKRAAAEHAKVADIQQIQLESVEKFVGIVGADGAHDPTIETVRDAMKEKIAEAHAERMHAIEETPDAYVEQNQGAMAGVQFDDTRKVGIAARVLEEPDLAERVAQHEGRHREQEKGDQVAAIPQETGVATIDALGGSIDRLTLREADAIAAEGGLAGHTSEYHDYVKRTEAVRQYVEQGGYDGVELTREAALNVDGFRRLQQAIILTTLRKESPDLDVQPATAA